MIAQYFAQINDQNIVLCVHVVDRDFLEANPQRYPGTWVETFIDDPTKTYAGEGYTYDSISNDFIAPNYVEPTPPIPTPEA